MKSKILVKSAVEAARAGDRTRSPSQAKIRNAKVLAAGEEPLAKMWLVNCPNPSVRWNFEISPKD